MTIAPASLVDRVARQLYDESHVNWSGEELVGWLREGLARLAEFRPDLFVTFEEVDLEPGARQVIPDKGEAFIRVLWTKKPGSDDRWAVTAFDMSAMDAAYPTWRSESPARGSRQFAAGVEPRTFWLYPPQPDPAGTAGVEYARVPAVPEYDVLTESDTIPLDSRMQGPLVDYVLYRAYAKDSEVGRQVERANAHYQSFIQTVRPPTQEG